MILRQQERDVQIKSKKAGQEKELLAPLFNSRSQAFAISLTGFPLA
jgi:hypothetical protein